MKCSRCDSFWNPIKKTVTLHVTDARYKSVHSGNRIQKIKALVSCCPECEQLDYDSELVQGLVKRYGRLYGQK